MASPPPPPPPGPSNAGEVAKVLRALNEVQQGVEMHFEEVGGLVQSAVDMAVQQHQGPADLPTPNNLETDLTFFRDLFAKLRFSYIEQGTKERFVHGVVSDPPKMVSQATNADIQASNAVAKSMLKDIKQEVNVLLARLEGRGREMTSHHEHLLAGAIRLLDFSGQIDFLEAQLADMPEPTNPARGRGGGGGGSDGPGEQLSLPLHQTANLVDEHRGREKELDKTLNELAAQAPRLSEKADQLQAKLGPLEAKRSSSADAAMLAREKKEAVQSGAADNLEVEAGWLEESETALKELLDLEDLEK